MMTRLGYPANRLEPPEVNYLPFQSDTSVVGLCVLCYSVFPIFRFDLKLFYFRYSKNTALNTVFIVRICFFYLHRNFYAGRYSTLSPLE